MRVDGDPYNEVDAALNRDEGGEQMSETLDLRLSWKGASDVYRMPGSCSNCGWKGTLILSKGSEAPTSGPSYKSARCKRCGCKRIGAVR